MYYFDSSGGGGAPPNQYPTGYLPPGDGAEHLHRVLQVENIGSRDAKLVRIRGTLQSGSKYPADKLFLRCSWHFVRLNTPIIRGV